MAWMRSVLSLPLVWIPEERVTEVPFLVKSILHLIFRQGRQGLARRCLGQISSIGQMAVRGFRQKSLPRRTRADSKSLKRYPRAFSAAQAFLNASIGSPFL